LSCGTSFGVSAVEKGLQEVHRVLFSAAPNVPGGGSGECTEVSMEALLSVEVSSEHVTFWCPSEWKHRRFGIV
jgi:hypothetical protein